MWWVINKETKEMIHSCDDAGKERCSIGGDQEWQICPEGISPGNCKVVVISAAVPAIPAVEAVEASEGVEAVEAQDAIPAIPEVRGLVDGSADKSSPQWDAMRAERDKRLTACDWTQGADSPLSAQAKADWADHRVSLRQLPANTASPESVIWPVAP